MNHNMSGTMSDVIVLGEKSSIFSFLGGTLVVLISCHM
jgi:hypothetical protein